jgi:hypothetical protein
MRRNIDDLLDQLLIEIEKGKSVKDCLKDNPEFASELEPLLKVALEIGELPKPEPRIEAINQTLQKIRRIQFDTQKTVKKFSFGRIFTFQPAIIRVAAIVLLVVLIGWSSIALSTRSMPGDLFYPVKIVREKVQYILTSDEEGKMHLHLLFANKRTKELAQFYKRKNQLNRKLVSAMLNEALVALLHTQSESTAEARNFLNEIAKANQYQRKVLEEICTCCCYTDIDVINEAINVCYERYHHIQQRLEPETHQFFTSYRYTWDRVVIFSK